MPSGTPRTAPSSPFFAPSTPQVTVTQQTPGGTKHQVKQKSEVEEHKSGLIGCTANLVNAIVGSGIVGIPYAIRQAGFLAGIGLIVLCAILTEKSLRLLVATAKHVHSPSYETAAEAAFGLPGFRFVALNMLIMSYGAMLSYLMVVKDSFSSLLGIDPEDAPMRRAILLLVSLSIQLPLSSKRDMADLAFTSRLSVMIDTVLVFLVVYNAPISSSVESVGGIKTLMTEEAVKWNTVFVGLGVLSFAFVCQHSAFIIAGSLEKPTQARWSTVTRTALLLCGSLALLCGVSGYLGYLDETNGNILTNLGDNPTANAARAMLGVTMLFVYPLESFVARHVCVVLLFAGRRAHEGDDSTILNRRDRRVGLTAVLYVLALVPAASFNDLGPVLAITGAIGGSCLSYIGPGLLFLGVHGERFMKLVDESWIGSASKNSQGNNQLKAMAGETTPLVATDSKTTITGKVANSESNESKQESHIIAMAKGFLWITTGMPLWYRLAKAGDAQLKKHAREMALKSPHPIRIGDVEYSRSNGDAADAAVLDPNKQLIRHDSLKGFKNAANLGGLPPSGLPPTPPTGKQAGGINQMLGRELLQKQKLQKKSVVEVEKDPQKEPANWCDFLIAIFYIMFGMLALCAGLVSLVQESDEGSGNVGRFLR